jgi:hypothetical protein
VPRRGREAQAHQARRVREEVRGECPTEERGVGAEEVSMRHRGRRRASEEEDEGDKVGGGENTRATKVMSPLNLCSLPNNHEIDSKWGLYLQ